MSPLAPNNMRQIHPLRINPLVCVVILILAFVFSTNTAASQKIEYISPLPGSSTVPPATIIVVRSTHTVTGSPEVLQRAVSLTGAGARTIYVNVRRAADARTLNIIPLTPLHELETVRVVIHAGNGLPDTSFAFTTVRIPHASTALKTVEEVQADTLPSDFPPIAVTTNNGATPLDLYIAPNSRVTPEKYGRFSMALDTAGVPKSYKRLNYWPFDFKVLPNGLMSISRLQVFSGSTTESKIFVMDTSWNVVDSIEPRNGYLTSAHDHTVLPNGHIIVQAWEDIIIDMSKIVEGGNPAALVVQGIIQELDQDRNVVFQWRTLEHIPITDSYEDLKAAAIRYAHNNGIWVDHDGDFLVSLRHCSSIIRIDRSTGDVVWKLGGKRNDFTFSSSVAGVTDPTFSYQHDIRRTSRGISLFDNGNLRNPKYSRAVEYRLDETAKTADLIWTYRHTPDIFVSLQGAVQTLPNQHRLVSWGSAAADGNPGVTEVDSNGTVVFEAMLPKELFVYRAQKHKWPPGRASDSVFVDEVLPLNTYTYSDPNDTVGITVTFTSITSLFYNATTGKRFPYAPVSPRFEGVAPNVYPMRIWLEQEGITNSTLEVRFNLDVLGLPRTSGYEVYHRPVIGNGTFIRQTTQFTPDKRTLVVAGTDFGEFLIADSLSPAEPLMAPVLVSPNNGEVRRAGTHQTLRVAPRGSFDSVEVQVSLESSFATVAMAWMTRTDKVQMTSDVDVAGMRYWRARTYYRSQMSEWSDVGEFELAAPFLTLDLPLNNFITYVDKSSPILWKTNISGRGRLELITKTGPLLIKDSVVLENHGYLWTVPLNTPVGTGYAIRITAYGDGQSDQSDTIVEVRLPTSVEDVFAGATEITAAPLPTSTVLTLKGEALQFVSQVLIFTAEGRLIQTTRGLGETEQSLNVEALSDGSYHCVLVGASGNIHIPIVIVR